MKSLVLISLAIGLLAATPAAGLEVSSATQRAVAVLDRGKLQDGMAMLEAAAAENDVSALSMLALIYLEAEQPQRGLPYAEAALKLAPKDSDILIVRGRVLAALKQHDKALADFDAALAHGPNAEALYERGALYSIGGEHQKALADFRLAFQTDPQGTDALASAANELEILDRQGEALAAWDLLIRLDGKSAGVLQRRGQLLQSMGRLEAATTDFEAAAKIDPKDAELQIELGAVWETRGDARRALTAYTAATRVDPQNPYGWWNVGRIAGGRKALAAFDRAVALEPTNAELLTDRGVARAIADDPRAGDDFDAALKVDPNSAYALIWRGSYLQAIDQPAKALADLDAAVKIAPTDPLALQFRASVLLTLNRHDRALADIGRSIELVKTPGNVTMRGEIYSAMGDHLQAIEAYDEAIALDPAYAEAWLGRAKSKAEMGDAAAAAADRARALKLDPSLAD